MKQKIIDTIRAVPIAGKTYEEYVETLAERLIAEKVIEKHPTADVVEVVRCKDCAWYNIFNECCTNTRGIFLCKPDGYCNYGERREE